MAQIDPSSSGGKKKKGAQKKMAIHVDFTPMVDMNMLLITFFMLCTTMIQSRTMQIMLPSNDSNIKDEQKNQADAKDAVVMILDTEYKADGLTPAKDDNGNTLHRIYYYGGLADTANIRMERFNADDNTQGIRQILRKRHKDVMDKYDELKTKWKNKEITKAQFDEQAKANAVDENLRHPVVVIKPGPNATYESLINAIDELNLNQIRKYSIQRPDHKDSVLLEKFQAENPNVKVMNPNVRK